MKIANKLFDKKNLTFSFFLLLSAEFIYNISSYAIHSGLFRILGTAEYGRYNFVIGFTTMIITLIAGRGGIPTAMAKRISENKNHFAIVRAIKKTALKLQTIIVITLTVILYLLAPIFAKFIFHDETLVPLLKLATLIVPTFAISSFHSLYFNGLKRFGAMTIMKASRGIFRILFIIGLAYFFGLKGAFWGNIFAPLFVFFVAFFIEIFIFKDYSKNKIENEEINLNEEDKKLAESYPWQNLLSYAGSFMLFSSFYELFNRLDTLYSVKILLQNDYLNGIYSASLNVALIPYYLVVALTFILFPIISNLKAKGNHEKIKKLIKKVILFLFASLIPTALFLILFKGLIVRILYGSSSTDLINLIPLMIGGTIFGTIFFVLAAIWNGAGYIKATTIITFLAIILSISLNYVFTPTYGITSTAIIFSITSSFMGLSLLVLTYFKFLKD